MKALLIVVHKALGRCRADRILTGGSLTEQVLQTQVSCLSDHETLSSSLGPDSQWRQCSQQPHSGEGVPSGPDSQWRWHSALSSPDAQQTHSGDGIDHAIGDLVLPHVLHHVELSGPLLGDDLVGDFLQLRVELLKQVFKQQGEQLGGGRRQGRRRGGEKEAQTQPTHNGGHTELHALVGICDGVINSVCVCVCERMCMCVCARMHVYTLISKETVLTVRFNNPALPAL